MNIPKFGFLFAASAAFFATSIAADRQHGVTVPEKLRDLGFFLGDWKGKQAFNTNGGPKMEGEATDHVDLIAGGRYLEEKLTTALPGHEPSNVRHLITWDPEAQVYRAWWFDDTSVNPHVLEGRLRQNVLVLETPPGGHGPLLRATYARHSDSDFTWDLEMKAGPQWTALFRTTYNRS